MRNEDRRRLLAAAHGADGPAVVERLSSGFDDDALQAVGVALLVAIDQGARARLADHGYWTRG